MQFMKLKHPRTLIAFNILSILGWISTFLFIYFMPYGFDQKHSSVDSMSDGIDMVSRWFSIIDLMCKCVIIPIIIYILESAFDIQIHNFTLPNNKIYSFFFEFGFFLYLFPLIWMWANIDYNLLPILYLILSYVIFKIVVIAISKIIDIVKSKKSDLE